MAEDVGVAGAGDGAVAVTQAHMFPPEYFHTVNPPDFTPHELRLKVEIPIILLRNFSPALGLANSTIPLRYSGQDPHGQPRRERRLYSPYQHEH